MKTRYFSANRMIILFSLTALLFFPSITNAQLYVTTANAIGIGTSTPGLNLTSLPLPQTMG
jgi:hypothetical protein